MKQDFDYIAELITDFFNDKHIIKRFVFLEEWEVAGWETWLQVEFGYFLSEHSSNPEWGRETTLSMDGRKEKLKWQCRPDFIIRKKGWKKESFVILEIKQAIKPHDCMNLLWNDLNKISKVKSSEIDARLKCGLGIFQANHVQLQKTITDNELRHETTVGDVIGDTGFAYLLFYNENF
jgi:hypothetical protein